MKNTAFIIASLLILFFLPAFSFAEDIAIERLDTFAIDGNDIWLGTNAGIVQWNRDEGVKNLYTVEDGLAGLPVRAIVVDHDGIKWFGTEKGLSRFDGSTWTTFTKENGLIHNVINSLAIDRNNMLWVATTFELSAFDGVNWKNYQNANGIIINSIDHLFIDSSNILWFTVSRSTGLTFLSRGLFRFNGTEWKVFDENDGIVATNFLDIAVDANNHPWISCYDSGYAGDYNDYLQHYDGTVFKTIKTDTQYTALPFRTLFIDKNDENNGIWYDYQHYLGYFDGKTETRYPFPRGSDLGWMITDMDRDDNGILWMITRGTLGNRYNYLLSFNGSEFTRHIITLPGTGVQKMPEEQITLRNYPNPFNPSTTISFFIPAESPVRLTVHDITGRLVGTLVDSKMSGGMHNIVFNGSGLSSGVYFYRLENAGMLKTGKMLLIK